MIRDNLTWPELYAPHVAELGNDFAGMVVEVYCGDGDGDGDESFRPGDEVYGMTSAHRGGTWAEYVLVTTDEAYPKPARLSWEEAAALPLSALTADQALFKHAGLDHMAASEHEKRSVLITGAAGAVGTLLVNFAAAAGYVVIAATSSNERNGTFLKSIGAKETTEYDGIPSLESVDVIIDTVGGETLDNCWHAVKENGVLVSIDSASWNFVEEHGKHELAGESKNVRALFFIVEPSKDSMDRISDAITARTVTGLVSKTFSMEQAEEAYNLGHSRILGRGKIILTP